MIELHTGNHIKLVIRYAGSTSEVLLNNKTMPGLQRLVLTMTPNDLTRIDLTSVEFAIAGEQIITGYLIPEEDGPAFLQWLVERKIPHA